MSVSYTLPAVAYAGNASTSTPYVIPFPFLDTDHIWLAKQATGETDPTTIAQASYTVTRLPDGSGGSLVSSVSYPSSTTVTIFRVTPRTQPTVYPDSGDFPAASHELALDRLTLITQEIANNVAQALGSPEAITVPDPGDEQNFIDTTTFADDTARNAATPTRIGQLGVQLDTNILYYGASVAAGDWTELLRSTGVSTLAYSATVNIIFDSIAGIKTRKLTLTGDVTFTFSSLTGSERIQNVIIISDSSSRTITWPAGVNWAGDAEPTSIPANSWLHVRLSSTTSVASGVYGFAFSKEEAAVAAGARYDTTSATSFAIGTGSKSFTVAAGLSYTAGQRVIIASEAAPTVDFMTGLVTAYGGTTLIVTVDGTGGSGTHTDWLINLSGSQGVSAEKSLHGLIEIPSDKTYTIVQYASVAGTISALVAKLSLGTLTAAVKINGTNVTGLSAVAVTTGESNTAGTAANAVAIGDTIAVAVSASSTPEDFAFSLLIS